MKNKRFYGTAYAETKWRAEDVKTIRPKWSMKKCEEELGSIEKHLTGRLIELGWEVMEDLLPGA
jgi:hypothetical protein